MRTQSHLRPSAALPLPLACLMLLGSLALGPTALAEESVQLQPRSPLPIDLAYTKPTAVGEIYQAVGRAVGVSVLFDPGWQSRDVRIEVDQVEPEEAFRMLDRASGSFHKVLNETTILVATDTPQNRRTYEEQVVKTYFLENADIPTIVTSLRSLVEAKRITASEEQRTVTVRDTAPRIALMSRLVEILDRNPAETQVDVAVLAVPQTLLRGLKSESEGVRLSREDLAGLRAAGDVTVLAEPSLSVLADGRASLNLQDAVPVRIPAADRGDENAEGYRYVDVGLKLRLRSLIHPESREVSLRTELEMESLVPDSDGGLPIRRSRQLESGVRLTEGQSFLITGLLDVDPKSPGLFGGKGTRKGQQVVVALTPRIVRESGLTEADLGAIWVDLAQPLTFAGKSLSSESPFDSDSEKLEAVRERLRERLAKLPRGLQSGGANENADDGQAAGDEHRQP